MKQQEARSRRRRRRFQPCPRRASSQRESSEERGVLLDPAAGSCPIRNYQARRYGARLPSHVARGFASTAKLHVERSQQTLNVHNDGLDLDDQQHARRRVARKQVVASPVSVPVERDLRYHHPARPFQHDLECVLNGGVVRVQETRKFAAVPSAVQADRQTEWRCHAPKHSQR